MKKYFLSIVALAGMLFATSCQESLVEPQMEGPTTFTVQLPDQMGTKADDFGHANNVDKLLVEVYPAGQTSSSLFQTVAEVKKGKATVALNLIQGQRYDILFWAQKGNNYVQVTKDGNTYSFDNNLTSIPMNDNFLNNDNGAAFFHAEKNFKPSGTPTPITLYRPFAQLNLGTTDASLNTNAGKYTLVRSSISVSGMATTFNAYTGEGEGEQNVTYNFEAAEVPTQSLKVGENTYKYVSMNYLSVLGNEKDLLDKVVATIIVKNADDIVMQPITHTFELVPVQENYRTNIVGNLISSTTDFKVLVDDDFEDVEYNYVAPGIELINGEYVIVSEEGLWSLAEHVNSGTKAINTFAGKTFKLGVDIDLKNQEWTPIGSGFTFDGTFDGDGHTIKNLNVKVSELAGLFGSVHGTIKNVKVQGAKISSHHYAGTIVGYIYGNVMNCEVSDAIIINTVEEVSEDVFDNGDKTGGIVGYVGENGNYQITGNKVNNVVITGYRDMGGIVGYLQKNILTGNEISDLTLVVDMTHNYKGYSDYKNVGAYYGFAGAGSKIDNAEEDNHYTISVIEEYVDVQADLNSNVTTEGATVILTSGNYTFPSNVAEGVTIICQEGTVFEGQSNLNIKGSTIIGATFKNETGIAVKGTINGVFENCTFVGKNALKSCYAGENVIFRNCFFEGKSYEYSAHFDGGANEVTFYNCEFSSKGRNSFGGAITKLNFIECTFNAELAYGSGVTLYCNSRFQECNFNFDIDYAEWINIKSNNITVELDGCEVNEQPFSKRVIGNYGYKSSIIIIDGKWYVSTEQTFVDALQSQPIGIVLASDITIERDWDNRFTGAKTTQPIVIDGNEHTLKFKGKVSDVGNYHSAFRFEASAEVRNLTIDMSEVAETGSWLRAISASSNLLIDNCSFIGSENYTKDNAVVIGDSNVSSQIDIKAEITNSEFTNWRRGISDNENAKEVREINISGNKFTNANVYVSAYGNIRFDGNEMDNSLINITSYTNAANAKVNAQNNTLDSDLSDYNVIGSSSKKFNAENVNAQDGFVVFTL